MTPGSFGRGAGLALGLVILTALCPAARAEPVDVELVLAVDSSGSIDMGEFALQRQGYAEALVHPKILQAIREGPYRAIAVTFVEWSGPEITNTVLGWTRISSAADARAVSDQLLATPRTIFGGGTAVGAAIDNARTLFDGNGFEGTRRVIDVSGDGWNNRGTEPEEARDRAVGAGITINGLAITAPGFGLDNYFRANVIGGPGAFVVPAKGFSDFARAILRKLIRELRLSKLGESAAVTVVARP